MTGGALLDVSMIVKNEEHYLPECLDALAVLRPILGGVYIYDTGSEDDTIEIGERWGAKVTRGYWDDDFARARNAGMAGSTATWNLQVDADERVQADVTRLAELLVRLTGDLRCDAVQVPVVLIGQDGPEATGKSLRLFRRDTVRYVNRVHERPVRRSDGADLQFAVPEDGVIALHHVGYIPEAFISKITRNLSLLEGAIPELRASGEHYRLSEALLNRGRTLAAAGRLQEAEADLEEMRTLPGHPELRLEAGETLFELLIGRGDWPRAAGLLNELGTEGQDSDMANWLAARLALLERQPEKALRLLRSVNRPASGTGMVNSWAPVLRARASAAAQLGLRDEALAAAVPLLAGHGDVTGIAELVLRLWGERPSGQLGLLLASCGQQHMDAVMAAFRALGPQGELVATAYRARCQLPGQCEPPAQGEPQTQEWEQGVTGAQVQPVSADK